MYKVRFHLANGPHYMHWQIKDMKTGHVEYMNPQTYSLWLINCQLKNSKTTAQKIHDGADKTVCAWIECSAWHAQSNYAMHEYLTDANQVEGLEYNPKNKPYWCFLGEDIDNKKFSDLMTLRSRVYHIIH